MSNITTSPQIATTDNNIFLKSLNQHNAPNPQAKIDWPCILVAGRTGTGKSRSIKNLPPDKTVIFNVEAKPLTFPGSESFRDRDIRFNPLGNQPTHTVVPTISTVLDKAIAAPEIEYIVFDSISKYFDLLLANCKSTGGKGYDIWNLYNDCVFQFLEKIKRNRGKFIILTALDELVGEQMPNGMIVNSRRVKTAGKVWEGQIESQFSIVLFTDIIQPPQGSQDKPQYKFLTYSDSTTSTKTPEEMFLTKHIDNDLKAVTDRCKTYFKLT